MSIKEKDTGFFDDKGKHIYVGDILRSEWNYDVIVRQDEEGQYYGELICTRNHPCKNMTYALNKGKGHIKLNKKSYWKI